MNADVRPAGIQSGITMSDDLQAQGLPRVSKLRYDFVKGIHDVFSMFSY